MTPTLSPATRWFGWFRPSRYRKERLRLAPMTLVIVAAMLAGTAATTLQLRSHVRAEEQRALEERANQSATVFDSFARQIVGLLSSGSVIGAITDGDPKAFAMAMEEQLETSILANAALLDMSGDALSIVAETGRERSVLIDTLGTAELDALAEVRTTGLANVVVSRVVDGNRTLGFAGVATPGGDYMMYSEIVVPEGLTLGAGTDEALDYAFYATDQESAETLVLSSSTELPLQGRRAEVRVEMGGTQPLIVFSPNRRLVGGATAAVPWLLLGAGLAMSLVVGVLFEATRRRRDDALRLVSDLEHKNVELDESEDRYRSLVEELPLVTYVNSAASDGSTKYMSPQVEDLLGYPAAEFLADDGLWVSLVHPDDRERVLAARSADAPCGGRQRSEFRLVARDGSIRWVIDEAVLECNGAKPPEASRGYWLDITERKRLETELMHVQKMEAVGQLAGGVAHDFNNLLTAVTTSASFLLSDLPTDDPLREEAEEIQKAADRAGALTQQLLAFSRRQLLQPEVVDVNEVVTDVEGLLQRLIDENVELRVQVGEVAAHATVDPGQLEQVIVNLAVNGRDAMPDGGPLSIEVDTVSTPSSETSGVEERQPGDYVRIAVRDAGSGMDEPTRERLFEPFFTTKAKGKGTGLGLATVYGIVTQSGGYVTVESELGAGSLFEVFLPLAEAEPVAAPSVRAAAQEHRGETILLVEDEDSVRLVARKSLERRGHHVIEATNAADALDRVQDAEVAIDLLVTDIVMPGLSGRELARQLRDSHPDLPVLYMSGYTDGAMDDDPSLEQGAEFLAKPFTPAALALKVDQVLGGTPAHEPAAA